MAKPGSRGIKGNVLLARLKYVREVGGDHALEAVLARVSPDDAKVLGGWVLPISWYPLDLYLRLDAAIASVMSPNDRKGVFLAMGRASADANLTGPQRPFVREGDPHFLLQNVPRMYAAQHSVGTRTYERVGAGAAVVRTVAGEDADPEDCLTAVGWLKRAIELSGGRAVAVAETQCRARGGACCEYACSWS
jgi:uncharacterized protein (TIGR02265 family)